MGPVDPALVAERLAPALELLDELGMDREALGDAQQLLVEDAQALLAHRRLDLRRRRAIELVLARRLLDLADLVGAPDLLLELLVQARELAPDLVLLALDVLRRVDPLRDELVGPDVRGAPVVLDALVHLRLRVRGLVGLVVAEAAV